MCKRIRIDYSGDKIYIEEKDLKKYQDERDRLIQWAMETGTSREEAEKHFYLKILEEE